MIGRPLWGLLRLTVRPLVELQLQIHSRTLKALHQSAWQSYLIVVNHLLSRAEGLRGPERLRGPEGLRGCGWGLWLAGRLFFLSSENILGVAMARAA